MTKSKIRILLALVIAVGLIAAVYTTALGASSTGVMRGGTHVTAGLLLDTAHQRSTHKTLQTYMPASEGEGHDCERDGVNPNDY